MARARLYIRRSDDDQSTYSPEAQERQNRLWCELHGHEVAGTYIDDDLSGTREQRADFQRLLRDVRSDPGSIVVVHKIDRFARDAETTLRAVKQFDQHQITLVSVMEQMDFSTPYGRMVLTMLAGMAEFYSRNLATEIKKGLREKAAQGGWIGPVPLGYRSVWDYDSKGERVLGSDRLVLTDDIETVRLAFEHYGMGVYSDLSVAEELNERGLTVIDIHTGERRPFGKDTVRGILTNPAYIGVVTCDGVQYPGKHPVAVDRELWERCQAIRQRRAGQGGRFVARGAGGLLSELAFCGRCGARLHWHASGRSSSRNDYYRCSAYRKFGKDACGKEMVPAQLVHAQMRDVLRALVLPPPLREVVIAEAQRHLAVPPPQAVDRKALDERFRRLKMLYKLGDLDDATYLRERAHLQSQLDQAPAPPPQFLDIARAAALLGDMPVLLGAASEAEQRSLIQQVFSVVWLEPAKITALKATKNYTLLVEAACSVETATPAGVEPALSTIPPRWVSFRVAA
jgi:site-specific DNA recombinase